MTRSASNSATFAVAVCIAGCVNPIPNDGAKAIDSIVTAGLESIVKEAHQSRDLAFAVQAFFRRQNRWPTTQAELMQFAGESNGYLALRSYDEIRFAVADDGSLGVFAQANGAVQRFLVQKPNKAPEPTPTSVTPPANEG